MGMCNDKRQSRKYNSFSNAMHKRLCLEVERLKRWREDGLQCRDNSINSRSVCVNASANLTGFDGESTTYEKSWALPRCRQKAEGLYLSWKNDR